ncbi:MAG: TolC family protein, partial [Thermodesulfobacteriota bacterium]|nr:TolC family protein [Thermodesulfobacteriota bacterium]
EINHTMHFNELCYKYLVFFVITGYLLGFSCLAEANEVEKVFTLEQTIRQAIKANLGLKSSREDTNAAASARLKQRSNFLPTLGVTYKYKRNYEERTKAVHGAAVPKNKYTFTGTFTQPVFTGFSLINKYKVAAFNLDLARFNEKTARQAVVFEANKVYFNLLKAQKLAAIAKEAVTQILAHKDVAKNFYEVGMTPLNDLLKAQVELANARQDLIVAQNNMETAKSNFNILLRRQINAPVEVKDIIDYCFFEKKIDFCFDIAEKNRLEIKAAELQVEIVEKELKLGKTDYYPSIILKGNYYKVGTDFDADGGDGISDPDSWDITATASWNFWEWGKTRYGVKEKLSALAQARYQHDEMIDNIHLEVKQAYLNTKESEQNIMAVKKAIEQAKENFRISEERYKEQMDTSTDVLDAQTLLSRTMTNYYNALYDFKISKAYLYWAMGQAQEVEAGLE